VAIVTLQRSHFRLSARLTGWLVAGLALAASGAAPALGAEAAGARARPNVLLIVADDLGFSDLGSYGAEIRTPNLDRLAADGLRFTQFYNTSRCTASRAALMTGFYPQQVNMDPVRESFPAWVRLLPDVLRRYGYRSYHAGKWHVTHAPRVKADGGFDHSYLLDDHDRYFGPLYHFVDDEPLPVPPPGGGYYATSAVADHTVRWLREHAAKHSRRPFFAYVAFTAAHFPLQALSTDIARYEDVYSQGWEHVRARRYARQRQKGIVNCALSPPDPDYRAPTYDQPDLLDSLGPGEVLHSLPWMKLTEEQKRFQARKQAIHAAMIERMDRAIGRIVRELRATGALDDTVVLFLSDNGASAEILVRGDGHDPLAEPGSAGSFLCLGPGGATVSNTPFRGHKISTHEGGVSTPLIVHWPAGIAARGELRGDVGHVVDVVPTILELAGHRGDEWPAAGAPPPPGQSLVPALARNGTVRRDYIYFHHQGHRALRVGDWKIVSLPGKPWELYDLARDRSELHDLAAQKPGLVDRMTRRWSRLEEDFRRQADGVP
jgi:arylsulfatase A-like enzyme